MNVSVMNSRKCDSFTKKIKWTTFHGQIEMKRVIWTLVSPNGEINYCEIRKINKNLAIYAK